MSIAIVDYGSGNLRSAAKAFERAARDSGAGVEVVVTDDPERVRKAERIVLPGVGAFADCKRGLDAVAGMTEVLRERVQKGGVPFLGICVGMQLMAARGLEYGVCPGLDWIGGDVVRIEPKDPALKVPHMGWNNLEIRRPDHPLLKGIGDGAHVYFVHSFHLKAPDDTVIATTEYGGPVTAMVGRDNMAGTQFHPEKSQTAGLQLIANFIGWRP